MTEYRSICIHDPKDDTIRLNPRWIEYARANGRTPSDQALHDMAQYPENYESGGYLRGFHAWLDAGKPLASEPIQQTLFT